MLAESEMSDLKLIESVKETLSNALSEGTKYTYATDIRHFENAGFSLPTNPDTLAMYLAKFRESLNPRTLRKRVYAISNWHKLHNKPDPTQSEVISSLLKSISRTYGTPKKKALALRFGELDKLIKHLREKETLESIQAATLVLVGFWGALRRGEIAELKWEDVAFESQGIVLTLYETKSDKMRVGQSVVIPLVQENRCPVQALLEWRKISGNYQGPVFRRISKDGQLLNTKLSGWLVDKTFRRAVKSAKLLNAEEYSAHSLRRGFATEAAKKGAGMALIQKHGRWKDIKMVVEYIEAGRSFEDSAINFMRDF